MRPPPKTFEEFEQRVLCTVPTDRQAAEAAIYQWHDIIKQPRPQIVWCGSPVGAYILFTLSQALVVRRMLPEPPSHWGRTLSRIVPEHIQSSTMWPGFGGSTGEFQNIDRLISKDWRGIYKSAAKAVSPCFDGLLSGVVMGHSLEYWHGGDGVEEMLKKCPVLHPDLAALSQIYMEVDDIIPTVGVCFVTERKTAIHISENQLHRDGGPALAYPDGMRWWFLNGVRVPQVYAETPGHKLDPRVILTEENADVRRELVRKIGVERVCAGLRAKCVDKWEDYELLMLDIGDKLMRPYLSMVNRSIGVVHIEGVHPDCTTVKKALAWRNGMEEYVPPVVLT